MTVLVRGARVADNAQIAVIWNHEARTTATTTDTEARGPRAQRAWLRAHDADYPAIVAVEGDEVLAFGALAPYRPKPSYRRTVEDSVYVKDGYRGKGLGSLVLDRLVTEARARDHHSMIARITGENEASLRLHERHGFVPVGREREAAHKLGRWLDVLTLQLMLSRRSFMRAAASPTGGAGMASSPPGRVGPLRPVHSAKRCDQANG